MTSLLGDLRFALRGLRRAPAFSLAAIATLALGIGATTAIFTAVNAALLKPLPYPQADDLYALRTDLTDGRVTTGLVSAVELRFLKESKASIVRAAASSLLQEVTLLPDDGQPMKAALYGVSEGLFDLFALPSFSEGLGIVVVEAQAAGTRALVSETTPAEAAVVPGAVEVLPLSAGAEAWGEAMARLLKLPRPDAADWLDKVEASRFGIRRCIDELDSIYRSELGRA